MRHAKFKTFIGVFFFAIWIVLLALTKPLANAFSINPPYFNETIKILFLYLNIPIFFIWLTLGISFGLPVTFVTSLFLLLRFEGHSCVLPIFSFVIMGYFGYKLNKIFVIETKSLKVDIEKAEEELNLLKERIRLDENENIRIRNSLKRIANLKNVIEDYGQTLSKEDILHSIIKNSFNLFENANRILLYFVDTERQELMLAGSRKRQIDFPVKAKKGDVFDRWVFKHRMPLMVEDIHNDFRFFTKEKFDNGFNSLISSPLTSEHRILGILRIDSLEKNKFSQSDLRFLDIMADLSAVCLQNALLYEKVQDLAIHDSLTGLYVQKYFIEKLKDELKRSLRNASDLSLLLLDLDNFKSYNDKYGHSAGDLALKHISSILGSLAEPGCIISRYGGEEFTVLLPGKDKRTAAKIAENIRQKISRTPLVLRREKTKISVSIGVASCPKEAKVPEDLLNLADLRLYKAKEKGRNNVCIK